MRRRFSPTRVALWVLGMASVASLMLTSPLSDGPAWWQAILSGAGIIATGLLWRLDKERVAEAAEEERRNLAAMIQGHVQQIMAAANELSDFDAISSMFAAGTDERIKDAMRKVKHCWLTLKPFRPYAGLGEFSAVSSLGDVERHCRELISRISGPQSHPTTGEYRRDIVQMKRRGEEIADACEKEMEPGIRTNSTAVPFVRHCHFRVTFGSRLMIPRKPVSTVNLTTQNRESAVTVAGSDCESSPRLELPKNAHVGPPG